jgi:hypothetical protein
MGEPGLLQAADRMGDVHLTGSASALKLDYRAG